MECEEGIISDVEHEAGSSSQTILPPAGATTTASPPPMDGHVIGNESVVHSSQGGVDQLERCGKWLSEIPRDDVIVLRQTPEYQDFLRAFERLGHAHRRVISMDRSSMSLDQSQQLHEPDFMVKDTQQLGYEHDDHHQQQQHRQPQHNQLLQVSTLSSLHLSNHQGQVIPQHQHQQEHQVAASALVVHHPPFNNFLQHLTADDVILRVFEFLECQSLIRTAMTCSRFRQLANRSASQRTYGVANARQLNNVMQLLRAKEQIDGVGTGIHDSHVRVPILLLSRRVLVTDAGDPEYNGVYFCTGSNGNGFVFTKPRYPEQRVRTTEAGVRYVQRPGTPAFDGAGAVPAVNGPEAAGGVVDGFLPPVNPVQRQFQQQRHVMGAGVGNNPAQRAAVAAADAAPAARFESEVAQPGQLLRCIIAKRFSNEVRLTHQICVKRHFRVNHTVLTPRHAFSFILPIDNPLVSQQGS